MSLRRFLQNEGPDVETWRIEHRAGERLAPGALVRWRPVGEMLTSPDPDATGARLRDEFESLLLDGARPGDLLRALGPDGAVRGFGLVDLSGVGRVAPKVSDRPWPSEFIPWVSDLGEDWERAWGECPSGTSLLRAFTGALSTRDTLGAQSRMILEWLPELPRLAALAKDALTAVHAWSLDPTRRREAERQCFLAIPELRVVNPGAPGLDDRGLFLGSLAALDPLLGLVQRQPGPALRESTVLNLGQARLLTGMGRALEQGDGRLERATLPDMASVLVETERRAADALRERATVSQVLQGCMPLLPAQAFSPAPR